jgi:ParB family chromosome partitioning protein
MEDKKVVELPVDNIFPNPYQPRGVFNEIQLEELAESIKNYGVIQPIVVRRLKEDHYELVSGERRLRACKIINIETIPGIVIETTDATSAMMALIENIQREDLNFFEEAKSYSDLLKLHKMTQKELAEKVGKGQSTVANKLRLLKIDPSVQYMILENGLSERHARALLRLPDTKLQTELVNKIIEKNLSVKRTEVLIEKIRKEILTNNYEEEISKDKKARVKSFINYKIYTNTVKKAYDEIKKTKIKAQYKEIDKDDHLEIVIKIPK